MEWEILLGEREKCFYNARTKKGFILNHGTLHQKLMMYCTVTNIT